MNLHLHSLLVSKDRPGHLSHCALAPVLSHHPAHEQTHTGQHGRRIINVWSDTLKLQSLAKNKGTESSPASSDVLGGSASYLYQLISNVHPEAPAPSFTPGQTPEPPKLIDSPVRFFFTACFLCQVRLLFLFPIFTSWLATAAFHFLSSHKRGISHYPFP